MADYLGGIAGKDSVLFVVDTVKAAHGPDSGVWRENGAFGHDNMAAEPHMMAKANGTVGVAPLALAVEKAVLVCVHNGAAPGGLHMVAEDDFAVADYQRRGTKVELVAESESSRFRDFDTRTCADGTLAKDVKGAAEIE